MKNRIIAIILVCVTAFCLCGCQLALPDGEEVQRDRLIGCFITTESLDLFDYEAYLNDNADKLFGGGEVALDGDTSAYQGRIYAEYYEETLTNSEGETTTNGNYRFADIDGISYFAPFIADEDYWGYTTFQTSEGLHEVNNYVKSFSSGDWNDGDLSYKTENYYTELSAKVYAAVDEEAEYLSDEVKFCMYPVYQSEDGSVYLRGVSGGFAMNRVYPDTLLTTTYNETSTMVINGEETETGGSVSIEFATAYAAERVEIAEMSAEAELLESCSFPVSGLPQSYEVNEDTAYILLTVISPDGHTERNIVAPDTENKDISALVESEHGWLESVYCEVLWKEEA